METLLHDLLARVEALEGLGMASNYPAIPDSSTPPPVATDEVEELVAELRAMATDAGLACQPGDFKILTRAANMIQRLGKQEAGR